MVYSERLDIIEKNANASSNWFGYLHLGVIYYANHEIEKSKKAFEKSVEICENPWALRNLAMIMKNEEKDLEKATQFILRALDTGCLNRGIIVNCAQTLTSAKKYEKWLEIFDSLPENLKNDGRLLFYKALSLLRLDRVQEAADIVTPDFVMCDIKEGEISISHLWYEIYEKLTGEKKYPLPYNLDFRMHE